MTIRPPSPGPAEPAPRTTDVGPFGRYAILTPIASGGMATVYVARMQAPGGFERLAAVKTLHPHLSRESEFMAMFLDEARVASRIRHPNVVSVLDVLGNPNDGWSIVMDYVEGDHLGGLLRKANDAHVVLPVRVALRIALDALEGLGAAHALTDETGRPLGVVHRDVSPQNLLVGLDGVTRLADFGVAKAESRLAHTREGQLKGKVGYMAPEQVSEGQSDARSDLFAMGVVLFETLTGGRLFGGESTGETIRRLLLAPIPTLPTDRPELAPLAPVLARALARDPAERFSTAHEFAAAIEAVAPECGGIAHPREVGELVQRLAGPILAERRSLLRAATTSASSHEVPTVVTRASVIRRIEPGLESVLHEALASDSPNEVERGRSWARRAWVIALAIGIGGAAGLVASRFPRAHVEASTKSVPAVVVVPVDRDARLVSGEPPLVPLDAGASLAPTIVVPALGARGRRRRRRGLSVPARSRAVRARRARRRARLPIRARASGRRPDRLRDSLARTIRAAAARRDRHSREGLRHDGRLAAAGPRARVLGRASGGRARHRSPRLFDRVRGSLRRHRGPRRGVATGLDARARRSASSRRRARGDRRRLRRYRRHRESRERAPHDRDGGPRRALRRYDRRLRARRRHARPRPPRRTSELLGHARVLPREGRGARGTAVRPRARGDREIRRPRACRRAQPARDRFRRSGSRRLERPRARGRAHARRRGRRAEPRIDRSGAYPLCRALLVYSRGRPEGPRADFLRFVLSEAGRDIVAAAHGFVPTDATGEVTLPEVDGPSTGAASLRANVLRVVFPRGETHVPESARDALHAAAEFARSVPGRRLVVAGHADSEGDEAQNVRVSTTRANVIADALVRLGVARASITVEGMGSRAPVATNTSGEGRARNRRVDLHLVEAPRDAVSATR